MNILVIKPSSFGDIIHTMPAVRLIRRTFPKAAIFWVVNSEFAGLIDLSSDADEVILFDRRRLGHPSHWGEIGGFMRDLRRQDYDMAFDFQGLFRSGLVSFLSGARRRIGFRRAREGAHFFYNERILLPANLKHAVDKSIFMVQSALNVADTPDFPTIADKLEYVRQTERLIKRSKLAEPFVAVAPTARWQSKTWPPEFFAAVMDRVAAKHPDVGFWLLGSAADISAGDEVSGLCEKAAPRNLMGETDFGTLTEMLRKSTLLLTNDSGPMHLAAAVQTKVLALFGPTDPELTGPYGPDHRVFKGHCRNAPCFLKLCPENERRCTTNITADEVADAIVAELNTAKTGHATVRSSVEA